MTSIRGSYLGQSSGALGGSVSNFHGGAYGSASTTNTGAVSSISGSTRHAASSGSAATKKRPISPEQVLRLFGPQGTTSRTGTERMAGRRGPSPASSPPSTTHQVYRERPIMQQSVPNIHELCTRTVSMSRDPVDGAHGFGICVKGGKDAGVGVYISRVEEGSVAERAGLRPGDSILEVNGTPFTAISHDEALKKCTQMLKSCRHLSMTVRSPPSLPMHLQQQPSLQQQHVSIPSSHVGLPPIGGVLGTNSGTNPVVLSPSAPIPVGAPFGGSAPGYGATVRQTSCSWMDRQGRPVSPPPDSSMGIWSTRDRSVRRVELCIQPGQSLGLMIRGGVEYQLGIYITGVDKDSVAERAGLMIGDQILEVNGQSFLDVTHDEAVGQLKFHKRMSLVVRDVGKVPHSCTAYDNEPFDPASPTSRQPRSPAQQMVEEKARSLLPRAEFSALCYYTQQYCSRSMTCEALVTVLQEMLNTPDKLTLMTELREIILPEDRVRFDELVYRRDAHIDPHARVSIN
ncbi:whirlin-like [Ctenocephalides felis]|uniref:whirlin-like n=1 Tax=Ctenocephalides felis TaxID=7515 RepID=UPI000E6E4C5A|nr:whirlin-like [Ctenocephalides felis]